MFLTLIANSFFLIATIPVSHSILQRGFDTVALLES